VLKSNTKQILKVFATFVLSLSFVIILSSSIESELSSTFDRQAASEQAKILKTLIESNMYELNAQTRIWIKGQGPKILKNKVFNPIRWENALLGFGNSTSTMFGNTRFILYNSLGHVIHNYKTNEYSPPLNLENENYNSVINTALDNESYENEFIALEDNSIKKIIVYPIEGDDYEVSHYFVMVLSLEKVLKLFKEVTQQEVEVTHNNFSISTFSAQDKQNKTSSKSFIKENVAYFKRDIDVSFLFPRIKNVIAQTYVDTTKMYNKVHEVRDKIVFFFSIIFIFFSILFYSMKVKYNQQKAMSYESSRLASLGEMAGGIAHEINNPLTVVKGHAFRMRTLAKKDKITNEEIMEYSDKIIEVVNRISQIVQSLRNLSRNDSGANMVRITTDEIAKDAIHLSQQKFKSRGVTLEYQNDVPRLQLDCRQVEISRVLVNLLNNAFDAVKESRVEVKTVKVLISRERDFVKLDIIDNGDGISKENMNKIMTPFFTTKSVGSGTGLGLSLSLTVVENHGGSIKVKSEKGNTVFSVTLPLNSEPNAA
jgi:signal transduction histidine kinase